MFNLIKKSLIIVKENPVLTLGFVVYLIVISIVMPRFVLLQNIYLVYTFLIVILLLCAAFFAGWFQMVKSAIENSKKEYAHEEVKKSLSFRKDFLEAIPSYILPVILFMVLYYVIFWLLVISDIKIAEKFFGSIDFLLEGIKNLSVQANDGLAHKAMEGYLTTLPKAKLAVLFGWQVLFTVSMGLFGLLTLFWPAAIYYGNKNPIIALWRSVTAVFKKPLGVIGLNIFIGVLVFVYMFLGALFPPNPIASFVYMILTIYLFVFLTVLVFNYFGQELAPKCVVCEVDEQEKTDNCDCRSDSVREDETCD